MNSLSIHRGFRIAILVSIVTAFAASQTITTAELAGAVADASGAAVVGATVVLKSMDTGETRAATSNGSGLYRFPFVKPGSYELSGTSVGLKSDTHRLSAAVGQALVVDLRLKPEQTKEVVVVTDAAPLLDLDNANLTYTLSQRQLELLPLPGEDMIAVTYSMPAVVINNNRYGAGNFASQGIGSLSNVFTVDGADVMDPYSNANSSGTTGLLLGANEIQEASVIQNAYDGHYGRQAGAQVNYVTKSGTNSYHGNLLYNYNGTLLNANDFFSNSTGVPRYHAASDQYAASFGGRVIKDKLFFFADTEALRYALGANTSVVAIPSPALQAYSLGVIRPSQVELYKRMFDLYNNAPGHERAVPVITGNSPLQDSSGRLGCGRLAGVRTATGAVFGTDVGCAEAWGITTPFQNSEWLLSTRADYNVSGKRGYFGGLRPIMAGCHRISAQ